MCSQVQLTWPWMPPTRTPPSSRANTARGRKPGVSVKGSACSVSPRPSARTSRGSGAVSTATDRSFTRGGGRSDQPVELPGVLARDLVDHVGGQVAELLGDVLGRLRPHAVGVGI